MDERQMDAARAERRETAWQELDELLAQVHTRTHDFTLQEIEADITFARREIREQWRTLPRCS